MATPKDNTFSSYDLSDDEYRQGCMLSPAQRCVIQNYMAEQAESKLLISIDAANPGAYVQEEAYLRGSIEALQYILALAKATEEEVLNTDN